MLFAYKCLPRWPQSGVNRRQFGNVLNNINYMKLDIFFFHKNVQKITRISSTMFDLPLGLSEANSLTLGSSFNSPARRGEAGTSAFGCTTSSIEYTRSLLNFCKLSPQKLSEHGIKSVIDLTSMLCLSHHFTKSDTKADEITW